ncbi:hypothetical protein GTY83_19175 [Streptomyces sp. SID4928]|uniref:hypothetical protein n=1 Tax=unclassified Streptomyces TaxID=2593676 RepID=UPI0001C1A56E|nr:hypothetical protein [Streptomyces sp. ACT-1]EGE43195.1 translation initiation factor IF-2 [Streptomyces sp. ACT-1]MYR51233.1 hypothetical protein [Streptomyces sp. SID4928]
MNVEDVVQERIAAARRRIANDKKRREELAEARKHGIAARHRQKLARLSRYSPDTREAPGRSVGIADGTTTPNTRTAKTTAQPADQSAPRRARGTGHGPILLTHARETEIGDAR